MADTDALNAKAREILVGNDRGGYTIPTAGLYPYQWNWDSCFAGWGFSTFDIDRAWTEFETLFASQWATGMVPHIIFHQPDPSYFPGPDVWRTGDRQPATSGISQPPVAATLARKVWESDRDAGRDRIARLYPRMVDWHRWWHRHRCAPGVACITHPWESGRDNCPDWDPGMANVDGSGVGEYTRRDTGHVDPSMRPKKEDYDRYLAMVYFGRDCGWDQDAIIEEGPFLMADPAMTFILIRAHADLAAIGRELGHDVSEIEHWREALINGLPRIWNQEIRCYDARDIKTERFAGVLGSGTFLAWYADQAGPELEERLMGVWDAVAHGIPSADPASPSFNPKRYWRGPMWPVVNSLIAMGFAEAGRLELAERLRRETVAVIEKSGFAEYYDPMDGSPCGGPDFTWTAAIWLTWASKEPEKGAG